MDNKEILILALKGSDVSYANATILQTRKLGFMSIRNGGEDWNWHEAALLPLTAEQLTELLESLKSK